VIAELHAEKALSSRLGPATTFGESYRESYAQRFASDLEFVRDNRPAFVSEARLEVMRSEALRMDDISRSNVAFQVTTSFVIHGDLWLNNILVTDVGEWSILDWDDLRIGDPMIDFAMLLGPSGADLRPLKLMDVLEPWMRDHASRERLAFYGRASLLDWVIDSLADYLDAETLPEHASVIRREKERVHHEAFDLYRRLYLA
jgi:aminoglycoside phosphotransferase (APT) family kinase protein